MKVQLKAVAFAATALVLGQAAWAGEAEAKKWIDSEFQPSTLSKDQQMAEMKWFIDAAKKLQAKGVKEISVVSETITTHEYESKTLAKAFEEITGIKVKHDLIQEGDVVENLQTSMQSGKSIYDGWISDSDLIGTHYRYGKILNLSSVSALGNRGQANYSAAKMGVQGFTRTLGIELGPFGINANAIAPGFIATEMTDATAARLKMDVEEFRKLNAEANPVKRVGFPEDIAAAAAFLCSDEASYITGQTLYVDGGAKLG